jgi:hypothetical protein
MGAYLRQFGNHKINFKNKSLVEVIMEIKDKLNTLKLTNEEHLRILAITGVEFSLINDGREYIKQKLHDRIRKYKEKTDWEWNFRVRGDPPSNILIIFKGFLNLEIVFKKNCLYFLDPRNISFKGWFYNHRIITNEWRRFYYQVIKLFGGDRIIYLPENLSENEFTLSDKYAIEFFKNKKSFKTIEKNIIKEYGINYKSISIKELRYLIDNFKDLENGNELTIDEFINEINLIKEKTEPDFCLLSYTYYSTTGE